jgi:hypothetical protein
VATTAVQGANLAHVYVVRVAVECRVTLHR